MFVMLLSLFIATLWSPKGKGLTSWLFCDVYCYFVTFFHLVSWDRCVTRLYRFLIIAVFPTLPGKPVIKRHLPNILYIHVNVKVLD